MICYFLFISAILGQIPLSRGAKIWFKNNPFSTTVSRNKPFQHARVIINPFTKQGFRVKQYTCLQILSYLSQDSQPRLFLRSHSHLTENLLWPLAVVLYTRFSLFQFCVAYQRICSIFVRLFFVHEVSCCFILSLLLTK